MRERVAQCRIQLALRNMPPVDVDLMVRSVADGDASGLLMLSGCLEPGQVNVRGRFDGDRGGNHEDNQQNQENVRQRGDIDSSENAILIVAGRYCHFDQPAEAASCPGVARLAAIAICSAPAALATPRMRTISPNST